MTDNGAVRVRRQDDVAQQRRRRDDTTIDGGQRLKLAIPADVAARLRAEGRTPRWVNDTGARMHNLTVLDDYDRVEGVEPVEVLIDAKKGTTCKAILCSKPTQFIEEDKGKLESQRRLVESSLERGDVPGNPHGAASDSTYVVEGTKITHGGRRGS